LAREGGISIAPTDRSLARRIGHLLAAAQRGSQHHVDAAVVAVCAATGGGVVRSADVKDIWALAGKSLHVSVRSIARS
jgi:hypothetical protein